jgi:hypothetical protein
MKLRLEALLFTQEDRTANWALCSRHGDLSGLVARLLLESVSCDRRDAERMLSLESHKANGASGYLLRYGQLYGFCGPFRAFVTLPIADAEGNITNFA